MSVSTPQADLANAETELATVQAKLVAAATAVGNAEKVMTNKGGKSSLANAAADIVAAQSAVSSVLANVQAAATAINTPTPVPPVPVTPVPDGPAGGFTLIFDEEFASLDTTVWNTNQGREVMTNVTAESANVTVNSAGQAVLTLSSDTQGALLETKQAVFKQGDYVETRVLLPSDAGKLVDWCGLYSTDETYPTWYEVDVFEVLAGGATVNTHWPLNSTTETAPADQSPSTGAIAGEWHVFGAQLFADQVVFYLDGVEVQTLPTVDNGTPQYLAFSMGCGTAAWNAETVVAAQMIVDYLRVWAPT